MLAGDYRKMLDRGRKAGLNTAELYRALTTCQPALHNRPGDQGDSNGFVQKIDAAGHSEFHPMRPDPDV